MFPTKPKSSCEFESFIRSLHVIIMLIILVICVPQSQFDCYFSGMQSLLCAFCCAFVWDLLVNRAIVALPNDSVEHSHNGKVSGVESTQKPLLNKQIKTFIYALLAFRLIVSAATYCILFCFRLFFFSFFLFSFWIKDRRQSVGANCE